MGNMFPLVFTGRYIAQSHVITGDHLHSLAEELAGFI
jgi:hypothetical protein